jgi:NTE family protein
MDRALTPMKSLLSRMGAPAQTALKDNLGEHLLFANLEKSTLKALRNIARWICVPGGTSLIRSGENADAAYFLITGGMIAHRTLRDGSEQVLGHIAPGEPVGEMALISGGAHTASVTALRDCELLRLDKNAFEALFEEDAHLAASITRIVLRRMRGVDNARALPRVFAVIATSPSIDLAGFSRELRVKLELLGVRTAVVSGPDGERGRTLWASTRYDYDVIFLVAQMNEEGWYRTCLRQADRLWVLAREDARPSTPMPLTPDPQAPRRRFNLVDLIMVAGGRERASSPAEWMHATGAHRVFRWRNNADLSCLARSAAGLAVGLVLSGGGARAYAHLGAIRALREAGVPFDFLGGSSMGAIIAAGIALGWDDAELEKRVRAAFVASNPIGDFQLPVLSFAKGERVKARLETHFGEARIEETLRPLFAVSSDLTEGRVHIHREGLICEALLASIALPGILPPVIKGNSVLVDGAVFANFPADLMESIHQVYTLGVDVSRDRGLPADEFRDVPPFLPWVMRHGLSSTPPIVSLLLRAASVHTAPLSAREQADALILPKLETIDIRDWTEFDAAVAAGYEAAKLFLAEPPAELKRIIEAARILGG